MKFLVIALALTFSCKQVCDISHHLLKDGSSELSSRWECQVEDCLYKIAVKPVDAMGCDKYKTTEKSMVASTVCSDVIKIFAGIGAGVISIKCQCNFMKVNKDLAAPSALCSFLLAKKNL